MIKAKEDFKEESGEGDDSEVVVRTSGDRWIMCGPCRYIPSTKVEVIEKRSNICLEKNEGVYVRDTRSGKVKLVSG